MSSLDTSSGAISNTAVTNPLRKPRTEEIDVFGLTHTGKVRKTNQDQGRACCRLAAPAQATSTVF